MRRTPAHIEPNLTSLIDVTFLLIVFFVLVSRLSEVENVDLNLPAPSQPASIELEAAHQVVLSVLPGSDGAAGAYRVGVIDYPATPQGLQAVIAHLADLYRANPSLNINLRADRTTQYQHVEPLMQAVSSAARSANPSANQAARLNLVVTRGQ